MKILFVTPFYPYPLDIGGKVAQYNLLKYLSKYHDIALLSLFKKDEDAHTNALKDYCREIVTVEKRISNPKIDFIKSIFPFAMSILVKACYEPNMYNSLKKIIQKEKFDLILYRFTQCVVYIQNNILIPQVLIEDDILYSKAKRQSDITKWSQPLVKFINYMEYLKIRKLETKAWSKVDAIVVLTEADELKIKQINSKLNVTSIPYGIDFKSYKPKRDEENLKDKILFLGATRNTLNVYALEFFLTKIWPKILNKKPSTKLTIIGHGFGDIFKNRGFDNVEELGFIEDIMPYFNSSKVFVVPLLNGGGLKSKVLEAMAAGCPIVTTTIGCEGIDLIDAKDAFIRNKADAFAEAVLTLLDDAKLRRSFSKNAREKATKNYNWDTIIKEFNALMESLSKKI